MLNGTFQNPLLFQIQQGEVAEGRATDTKTIVVGIFDATRLEGSSFCCAWFYCGGSIPIIHESSSLSSQH